TPVMGSSHDADSAMMRMMDQLESYNHVDHASQSTHQKHTETTDIQSAPDDPMKDCVSLSCCLITREEPVLLQAWQYLSTLSFDKSSQAFFVEYKPGSKDRPPKHL
ncbi:MAG: hypothetical protein ACNA7M_10580, partial [Roseovarius sp.]